MLRFPPKEADRETSWKDDGEIGWRPMIRPGWFLPIRFASREDCQIGCDSANLLAIDWELPPDELREQLRLFGLDKLRKVLVENLRW